MEVNSGTVFFLSSKTKNSGTPIDGTRSRGPYLLGALQEDFLGPLFPPCEALAWHLADLTREKMTMDQYATKFQSRRKGRKNLSMARTKELECVSALKICNFMELVTRATIVEEASKRE